MNVAYHPLFFAGLDTSTSPVKDNLMQFVKQSLQHHVTKAKNICSKKKEAITEDYEKAKKAFKREQLESRSMTERRIDKMTLVWGDERILARDQYYDELHKEKVERLHPLLLETVLAKGEAERELKRVKAEGSNAIKSVESMNILAWVEGLGGTQYVIYTYPIEVRAGRNYRQEEKLS